MANQDGVIYNYDIDAEGHEVGEQADGNDDEDDDGEEEHLESINNEAEHDRQNITQNTDDSQARQHVATSSGQSSSLNAPSEGF
ncbi:hypothetical protein HDU76_000325, partial [Blyttiomyces sp. JEL0837]